MALHPSTHVHSSSTHASHTSHAHAAHAAHAASKVKPSLNAEEGEGGGFAAQLLKAQPPADKDLKAADLLLGLRVRAVGGRDLAVFPVEGDCGLGRLKSCFGDEMYGGAEMVVVLKTFVEHMVALGLRHVFEFAGLEISQTDVFHPFLLVSGSGSV